MRFRAFTLGILSLALAACGGGGGGGTEPPAVEPIAASTYPQKATRKLPMRDGVRLSTDIFLPGGSGPWPVVLIRTPYNKTREAEYAAEENARGIAVLSQDMRGRFDSEGANLPMNGCGGGGLADDYDTMEWITQQWWCNGKIGTTGGSCLGITQNMAALTQPPGLACQFIGVATASVYHEFIYTGGALREEQVVQWLEQNKYDPQALSDIRAHPLYDDYWRGMNIAENISAINTPGMHYGCWFDTFSQGTLDSYMLRQHEGGPGARGRQWLIMGPWTHAGVGSNTVGELTFPDNAKHPPGYPYDRWTDHWLLGGSEEMARRPKVTYYLMGPVGETGAPGNYWRYVDDWPVPTDEVRFYIHSGGGLSYAPPAGEAPDTWAFDPANPAPTQGGRNLIIPAGSYDQRTVEARGDNLVYTTEPLAYPIEAVGRLKFHCWVASDAANTDVVVRLTDVYPDGRSMLVADGILRLSARDGVDKSVPVVPGTRYEVEVDLWSTAYVFNTGHQLRVSVTGSNYPRWDINPGTGAVMADGGPTVVQHNTLYHDNTQRSYLILPVPKEWVPPAT